MRVHQYLVSLQWHQSQWTKQLIHGLLSSHNISYTQWRIIVKHYIVQFLPIIVIFFVHLDGVVIAS